MLGDDGNSVKAVPVLLEDRFEIEGPAGRGGMGAVYRAVDRMTGERAAIKIVPPRDAEDMARFEREIDAIATLSHPGIVRYVAHGRVSGSGATFLAMEWIEGPSLRERLASGVMSVNETIRCGAAIARALDASHTAGIVHRDVKPGNVMLQDGDPAAARLVDFGVAFTTGRAGELTIAGSVIGTTGYMAPEQARGASTIGPPADIYALGCLLFRCLTGETPFTGEEVVAVLVKLVLEDAPRLLEKRADVPVWLDDLVASMLAREPEYRPSSASAIAALLEGHVGVPSSRPADDTPGASAARIAITKVERRIGCAVLAAAGAAGFTPAFSDQDRAEIAGAARPFRADVHFLADGSVLAVIPEDGPATDRAARAARAALSLRGPLWGMPLCILVGHHAAEAHVAQAIDRYMPLLRRDSSGAIRLDETAAGLLDARFDIGGDELGLFLRGERDAVDVARTLLGRPTPCVGRDREISALRSLLNEVTEEGVTRAALVTAEAGAGKSRLRQELVWQAAADRLGPEVWIGRADPVAAGSPFALLGQALRRVAGIAPADPPDVARRKLRARAGRHITGPKAHQTAEFLGEMCGVPFDEAASVQLRAARRDPELMSAQISRAFEALVQAQCEAGPLAIVLEDLHWGDLPSVRCIDTALGRELPLFVLALARPEVHARFPGLFRLRSLTEIRLAPLSRKSSARLVREVLGQAVPEMTVDRIVELSMGNAFYLEELIRAAASGAAAVLPGSVMAMAQSVLETLDAPSRRVLRAGSVLGVSFRAEGLAALLDVSVERAHALLAPLIHAELLTRRDGLLGAEELTFRHALLREAAYSMLSDEDRARGHRAAAEFLAASGEHDAMLMAEHAERGGDPESAIAHYLRAAEQALSGNDLETAWARAERGIHCGAAGEALGKLHLVLAETERWRGKNTEGRAHALSALALLSPGTPSWCVAASELASCALKLLEPKTIDHLGVVLLSCLAPPKAPSGPLLIACARVAAAALLGGCAVTGRALLGALSEEALMPFADAPFVVARAWETRAIAALCEGDMCAFLSGSERAAAAFSEIGDVRSATIQRANQGHVYGALGAYEQAEGALREVIAAVEHVGLPQLMSAAQQNLGNVLMRTGRTAEARALLEKSLEAAIAQGDRRLEFGARVYLSLCALLEGHPDEALDCLSVATSPEGMPALHVYALGARAHALLRAGRLPEAMDAAASAAAFLAQIGDIMEEGEILVRLARVETLLAFGRADEARAALLDARRALDARAVRISGTSLREAFLSRVSENARVLQLEEVLG